MNPTIRVKISICLQVSTIRLILGFFAHLPRKDGGWLSQHPIPSDKGTFGQFENVQLQNEAGHQAITMHTVC